MLQPNNEKSWSALEVIMPEDIFVTAHITLNKDNITNAEETLERLAKLEVQSLSLTISESSLQETYSALRDKAAELGLTLRSDLPVPYSADNPVAFETQEDKVPEGAGKAWLYVEPDGDVLPTQGMADKILGNFLHDEWSTIHSQV
jgi:sulfatase maturation enzyme AslB (radical SAM superfamily)